MNRAAFAYLAAALGLGAGFAAGFAYAEAGWFSLAFAVAALVAVLTVGFSVFLARRLDRRTAIRLGAIGEAVGQAGMQRGHEVEYVEAIVATLFQSLKRANSVKAGVAQSSLPVALLSETGEISLASQGLTALDPDLKRGAAFPDFAQLAATGESRILLGGTAYRAVMTPSEGEKRIVSFAPEGTVLTDEMLGAVGEAIVSGATDPALRERLLALGPALAPVLQGIDALGEGLGLLDGVLAGDAGARRAAEGRNDPVGARARAVADLIGAYETGREEEEDLRGRLELKLTRIGELVDRHRAMAAKLRDLATETRDDGAIVGMALDSGSEGAEEARRAGGQARGALDEAVQAARLNNEAAASLGTLTAEIAELVSAIEDVSFRTNLIALNASVEAARAGEKGAGFAVVAEEVRMLAQNASRTAKEIRGLVARGQAKSQDGVAGAVQLERLVQDLDAYLRNLSTETDKITDALSQGKGALAQVDRKVAAIAQDADRATGGAQGRAVRR